MMIKVDPQAMDELVLAWLWHTLCTLEHNSESGVYPSDKKTYKKDIKAVKHLIKFLGD
jgi:hypothetical protein